jgi:cation:H+ antiporter
MLAHIALVVAGLVLLPVGAELLVRGSTGLALRLGVTALAIGLTVVAFGTGSPELVLSIQASATGNGGIALGNVIGSNISNIALVLGVAALVRPLSVRSQLVRREVPIMIAATVVLGALLLDGSLGRLDGLLLVVGAITYTVVAYRSAEQSEPDAAIGDFDDAYPSHRHSARVDAVLVALGLAALLAGAQLLLEGAVYIAAAFGVSQVVIGLTVIAVGTSLPELATSVTSAIRNEADVAFGNVLGSNVLNIFAVLGVASLVRPFGVEGLRPWDFLALVGSAVALLPLMRRGWVLNRWEGAILLGGYAAYIASLVIWPA